MLYRPKPHIRTALEAERRSAFACLSLPSKTLAIGICSILLVACGGGSGTADPTPATTNQSLPEPPIGSAQTSANGEQGNLGETANSTTPTNENNQNESTAETPLVTDTPSANPNGSQTDSQSTAPTAD